MFWAGNELKEKQKEIERHLNKIKDLENLMEDKDETIGTLDRILKEFESISQKQSDAKEEAIRLRDSAEESLHEQEQVNDRQSILLKDLEAKCQKHVACLEEANRINESLEKTLRVCQQKLDEATRDRMEALQKSTSYLEQLGQAKDTVQELESRLSKRQKTIQEQEEAVQDAAEKQEQLTVEAQRFIQGMILLKNEDAYKIESLTKRKREVVEEPNTMT